MKNVLSTVFFVVFLFVILFFMFRLWFDKSCILNAFRRGNVIVYGHKGKGKDLLFQGVIKARNKEYFSNISYGGKFNEFNNSKLELGSNSYEKFIDGNVDKLDLQAYPFEKKDVYISDGGIILPSQNDSMLHKKYPSFCISYALSRHLWANNIHINSQSLTRVWKALREQADYYIKCIGVIKLPFVMVVKCITYDKYESAERNILPMKTELFNKENKALYNQFCATNGSIQYRYFLVWKKHIKYDTRAYKKIIFKDSQEN